MTQSKGLVGAIVLAVLVGMLVVGVAIVAGCGGGKSATTSSTTGAASTSLSTTTTGSSATTASTSSTTAGSTTASSDQGSAALQLVTPSGTKSFTLAELEAMPAVEAYGGIKNSAGNITPPVKYKGVAVMDVLKTAGGLPAGTGVSFVAKDGYEMTMSADQVQNGNFTAYDVTTGDEITIKDPLQLVFAYENEGKPLDPTSEGPLRLVILSPQANEVTDGHWWVKWVNKVQVKTLAAASSLQLVGAISDSLDRGTIDSCSAPSCHGVTWKDADGKIWSGVPLYYLLGRVDDSTKHGNGAFNSALAAKGYQIDIVGNANVTLDSSKVALSKEYIVANKLAGEELSGSDAPLRLVGPALQKDQSVGGIKEIRLLIK